ncbi:O-antigen polymerase [Cutibacterium granulosum]|uniref:O-antigen polymerase n=1 Tax=Cutibacterium granulosum TaxID=33011 RepID=UPI002B22C958|nr:O-antigen polymerase [Cutibacterium granulosum]MEA5655939.1 O-antigen polymerase [Cutibacterium granulosum]
MLHSGEPSKRQPLDRLNHPAHRQPARLLPPDTPSVHDHRPYSPRRAIPDDELRSESWYDSPEPAPRHTTWAFWLEPRFIVIAFSGVLALCTFLYPANRFDNWSTSKYFNTTEFALTVAAIAAFCLGMTLTPHLTSLDSANRAESDAKPHVIEGWYHALGLIVVMGYVAWAVIATARGATLALFVAVIHRNMGAISFLKQRLAPVSGVTTLTQVSCIVSALGAYRYITTRKIGKLWCFVLLTGTLRALFYAERLALMEVVIPAVLVLIMTSNFMRNHRFLMKLIPVIGLAFLVVVFSASEYFRSWIFYSQSGDTSFAPWVLDRLLAYYATSFNNNALFHSQVSGVPHPIYFTLPFVFDFPGFSSIFGTPSFGGVTPKDWWFSTLSWYATPEFNNSGSYLTPIADLGLVGGLTFWLILGVPIGYVYRRAREGSDVALIAYSTLFLGLLEMPRFTYWTLGRFFPAAVALIFFMGNSMVHGESPIRKKPHHRHELRESSR